MKRHGELRMVKELLLGDNPFIGVSHLSQEKAREERNEVSLVQKKVDVIKASMEGGVTGFTFSTHELNLKMFKYISDNHDLLDKLNYYILVPYAQGYVRKANVIGTAGLATTVLNNIVRKRFKDFVAGALTMNFKRVASLFIVNEVEPYLKILPKTRVKAILLHEVLVDIIVAYELIDLLKEIKKYVESKLGVSFGLETRNVSHLFKLIVSSGVRVEYVMTPMNPLGYQMAFSKEVAEKAIEELASKLESKVIAINILASGAVTPIEACEYLRRFKEYIYAVTYSTSKPSRAKENALLLAKNLL